MHLPQYCIFDLDGTLLDSAPGIRKSLNHAIATVLSHAGGATSASFPIGPTIEEIFARLFPQLSRSILVQLVHVYRTHYDSVGWMDCQPYPGVREMLERLESLGLDLLVVTNKPAAVTRQLIAHFDLNQFFLAVASVDAGDSKTSNKAALIQKLLHDYNLTGSRGCLIGDRASDAQAARMNQLDFIWAAYGYGSVEEFISYGAAWRQVREPMQILDFCETLSAAA